MLIDINAHVGHWPFKKLRNNTCRGLLDNMNQFGVDISVVSNLNGVFYRDSNEANKELFEEIRSNRAFAGRFIPFGVINPSYPGWQKDLEICYSKLGMKGVCLYPLYHDYELMDPNCIELVKRARDKGMIVTFAQRIVDSRQRSWMDISKEWTLSDIMPMIWKVPDARYFIVNAANRITVNIEDTELLKKTEFLFDTSGRMLSKLGDTMKVYGNGKFAFGTHSPVLDYLAGLLRIESLNDKEADDTTKELLRSGNAARMLGL